MRHLPILPSLALLCGLAGTSCQTPVPEPEPQPAPAAAASAPGYDWRTTHNGVAVWHRPVEAGARLFWQGPVNQQGQAHGLGVLTRQQPPDGAPAPGVEQPPLVTTALKGGMIHGRFEGLVVSSPGPDGKTSFDRYSNGEWASSETGDAGQATLSQMPAVDSPARSPAPSAPQAQPGRAAPPPVTASSAPPPSPPVAAPPPPRQPLKRNLIDQWGLRRTQGGAGDHIKFYIMAADEAYESYEKSGSDAYYQQHEQYAELTRAFHERTGGGATGFSR